ncbi:MAG: cell wall hydrolase, partial [Methanophagales archaeon]|nr:cell wall hydrolase [Methanophagales archaeon]
ILNDRTGESYLSTMIAFDAVKFVPVAAPNTPPYTPSNPSPATHATGQSIHTDLSWTGGDPDAGDTVTYDVYFGTSTRPLKVSTVQSGTTYDPGTLSYSTYYWRIVARDNHGASTTGPLWDFTTGSALTCAIELRKQGTTTSINEIDVGKFFDIYVGDSTDDTGIREVRFSSDESQDGIPTGEWTVWYDWDTSSGDWNAISKTKAWLFTTEGSKEVWAEIKDGNGQTRNCFANIVTGNLYWLAKAIMSEASVGRPEERIAVGWTVLNRLDSNDFPSTIKQVVESGYAYNQEPTQKIIDLSKDILERKYSDPTGGATYFFSPRSMTSGYGPYEISGTNKKSLIPSWAIPKGYSKTSPPPSDWEMTEFYKTIENLEWVSGLEDIRIWYFMFYRSISDSQEELIHSPIQQERIVEKDVPVTIEGNQYIIATL